MNPIRQAAALAHTRRTFLRRGLAGLGAVALADLAAPPLGAKSLSMENPLAPKLSPLRARAKRVIYLHMSGSPPQHDLFDYKPELIKLHVQAVPGGVPRGQAVRVHQGHPKLLGTPYKFEQHGKSGHVDQRAVRALSRGRRRRRVHQVDVHRPVQPRPGANCSSTPAPSSSAGRRWARGSPTGSAPRTRTCPASSSSSAAAATRRAGKSRLEQRLPPERLPGRAVPHRRRADPLRQRPEGHEPRHPPARRSTPCSSSTRYELETVRRPRDAHAHQPVRAGLPHADGGARGDGHRQGAGGRPRGLRREARAR